jgi:hypothetical protein
MSYHGPSIVDLTDDTDSTSRSSTGRQHPHHEPSSSYATSSTNPAKRSRIDTTNMNPLALLNPRAFVANGLSPRKSNDKERNELDIQREPISFNRRIEALHGIKDRKTKAPSTNEIKGDINVMESGNQRRSTNSLLSKNSIQGTPSADVIDLTGPRVLANANNRRRLE